jgi:hypothetical protein
VRESTYEGQSNVVRVDARVIDLRGRAVFLDRPNYRRAKDVHRRNAPGKDGPRQLKPPKEWTIRDET